MNICRDIFLRSALWVVAWLSIVPMTQAAECTLSTQGIAFGNYDPFINGHLDSAGEVTVSCDSPTPYVVSLSPGNGSYSTRVMSNGDHELLYNLYLDASHSTIWGDGTAGTAAASATGINDHHIVYGRIPARQNAFVGNYGDVIVVTLTF